MRFNIEDYPGKHVMHCKTQIEATSFTAHLTSIGKTWNGGGSYIHNNHWRDNEEDTCYDFNMGMYCNFGYFKDNDYTILEWSDFMYDTPAGKIDDENDYDKTLITIDRIDFFRLPEENGLIPLVARDCITNARFDDNSNNCTSNFAKSTLLKYLVTEVQPRLEAVLGDNMVYFDTDLTTICGNKVYGTINTKISLPTLDMYRNNLETFSRYSKNTHNWWLATPWDTMKSVCMVMGNEELYYEQSRYCYGIRPVIYVKASALTTQN